MDVWEYSSGGKHPKKVKVACAMEMGGVLGVTQRRDGLKKRLVTWDRYPHIYVLVTQSNSASSSMLTSRS